jgi:hypothetical protein
MEGQPMVQFPEELDEKRLSNAEKLFVCGMNNCTWMRSDYYKT